MHVGPHRNKMWFVVLPRGPCFWHVGRFLHLVMWVGFGGFWWVDLKMEKIYIFQQRFEKLSCNIVKNCYLLTSRVHKGY